MKGWNTPGVVSWGLQLVVAGILLQTLFFKFTGAAESVYIFSTLGVEPWGRLGSGRRGAHRGDSAARARDHDGRAVLALAVMAGAIGSHLTVLGIEVRGDGGLLFALALHGLRFLCGNPRPAAQRDSAPRHVAAHGLGDAVAKIDRRDRSSIAPRPPRRDAFDDRAHRR